MKSSNKNKAIVISIIIVLFLVLVVIISTKKSTRKYIETEGIDIEYRVYTEDGYSRWYKNGEKTTNKKSILGIEIKTESKKSGHIFYNTFGDNDTFDDKDSYDSETAGNKKNKLYGIKIGLTDDLDKSYDIYYRTNNKKDGWLDWTSSYNISGDNGVDIEKIQIKVLKKNSGFDHKTERTSIGF